MLKSKMKPAGREPLIKEEYVFKQKVKAVDMKDDFAETQKSLEADDALVHKLVDNCGRQSAEWDEHQRNGIRQQNDQVVER